jgi:5-hydroxyisourate hydrolase
MMTGQLTTHVLDTANGCPAANLRLEVWFQKTEVEQDLLKTVYTNVDGRTDEPLLSDDTLVAGRYELVFYVGQYFAQRGLALPEPYFLDHVPVRFGIADPYSHYHVPLLVSPWSYSTYRGS